MCALSVTNPVEKMVWKPLALSDRTKWLHPILLIFPGVPGDLIPVTLGSLVQYFSPLVDWRLWDKFHEQPG